MVYIISRQGCVYKNCREVNPKFDTKSRSYLESFAARWNVPNKLCRRQPLRIDHPNAKRDTVLQCSTCTNIDTNMLFQIYQRETLSAHTSASLPMHVATESEWRCALSVW
ncbi:hypothetical protein CBL_07924 [Carabus blaptoides fortunei]